MRGTDAPEGAESDASGEEPPVVSAHRTSPNRTVFTEEGNSDAWIATDLVVDVDG
ncbi:MAG: hypothetical protein ABEJ61_07495 [Haloferacaceae archaeon]